MKTIDGVHVLSSIASIVKAPVLCVGDRPDIALMISDVLNDNGFEALCGCSAVEMDNVLSRQNVDLVLSSARRCEK